MMRPKLPRALLGLSLLSLSLGLLGYDNQVMHPAINQGMLDYAKKLLDVNDPQFEKFRNYDFDFGGSGLLGMAVTNPGYTVSTYGESEVRKDPGDWIEHGGLSADEPEIRAALRHFYDPTGIDGGKTHLSDRSSRLANLSALYEINPAIDAKRWALSHEENPWNWLQAKIYLTEGLFEKDPALRERHFAKAYRALGEVLHLLADMGCPSHVRNDAHAAVCGWDCEVALGNPDSYEALVKPEWVQNLLSTSTSQAQEDLKQQLRTAERAEALFEILATHTNANFFSQDTITGTHAGREYSPAIADRPAYPSPRLEALEWVEAERTFYRTFDRGLRVKLAKLDSGFFSDPDFAHIDSDCAESQAAVLLPNIAEAGANLVRLFFPDLQIEITRAEVDGSARATVEGRVSHRTDLEHASPITYAGPVELWANYHQVAKREVGAGATFHFGDLDLKPGDKIYALIALPGLFIKSAEQEVGQVSGLSFRTYAASIQVASATLQDACGTVWTEESAGAGLGHFLYGGYMELIREGDQYRPDPTSSMFDPANEILLTLSPDGQTLAFSVQHAFWNADRAGTRTEITVAGNVPRVSHFEDAYTLRSTFRVDPPGACSALTAAKVVHLEWPDVDCAPSTMIDYACSVQFGSIEIELASASGGG